MTKPTDHEIEALREALAVAKAARSEDNTRENRDAVKSAWNALNAALIEKNGMPKASGYGCRAGRRQHAACRAETARRMARKRRW